MGHIRTVWRRYAWGWFAVTATIFLCGSAGTATATTSPRIDERIIPLKPGTTIVRVGFLTGEFDDLRVTEHVDHATGRPIGIPLLRGTLTVKNDSFHQAAHLLVGKIQYVSAEGTPIVIPPAEGDTTLRFIGPTADRLEPGQQVSLTIAVPYPATALTPERIREVGLELTYTSVPYRQDTAHFPIVVGG